MSAAELLADLGRLGIRLEAEGDRLRYHPRSALTPDLLARLKFHKAELVAQLLATSDRVFRQGLWESAFAGITHSAETPACRCGSTTSRDVPIHDGQSVRRDCGRCGRFVAFPVWYGKDTGHNGQHPV